MKLLQGDLAEAWREGDTDYATVAMRYALNDTYVDQSGRVVEGGPDEATEVWTFRRSHGGKWLLSAIQQTLTSVIADADARSIESARPGFGAGVSRLLASA